MKKFYIALVSLLILSGCATYKAKFVEQPKTGDSGSDKEVSHTFYLIGDAGQSPEGDLNSALKAFKAKLDKADENSTALFLGDNIYPAGLPDKKDSTKAYQMAKNHLDAQLNTLENFNGRTVFIPGNHDWYNEGPKGLKRQERYIEKALDKKNVFLPENGCPIEKIDINDQVVVIAIDTEWYITNWDKYPTINDECDIKDKEIFLEELEGLIKKNRDKTTILALHHPMFSYGSHAGQYSFKQHIFPFGNGLPLPVIGTLVNVLRRSSGASTQDLQNEKYNQLKKRIVTLAQYSEKIIFVSGHEHTLQYIVEENTPQIVSGSGAKEGSTRLLNGAKFSTGQMGYAVLKVFTDGSSEVEFFGGKNEANKSLFISQVLPADRKPAAFKGPDTFPPFYEASIYTDEEVDKSGFHKSIWGERYRKYYGTKVKAPTAILDTLYGGLTPVRKGGGHQSKSLRLQHADGRQFVMRALKKSAELYLQAIIFKDDYVVGDFDETSIEKVIEDFYTGAHPYAPFTIAGLSDAVGVFHTNPQLFYVPKQKALADFNDSFGDELYMIEEHVSEGHTNTGFGKASKIESTGDFLIKLREDEEYRIDRRGHVRARLFDILLGDWDRHHDQWRWAQFKNEDGTKIFRPIPRDRDQAFSNMGDGALMWFATRTMPGLKLFEGFNAEVKSVEGLNSSPKTFALDIALLSGASRAEWQEEAKYIQDNLTAEVIDSAFLSFPEEVRDETINTIKRNLLARKDGLAETALDYFKVLNEFGVVIGTDKDDYFTITPMEGGKLDVKVHRIKGGEKSDLIFDKIYEPEFTKEIWLYGLDDDDVFEVKGSEGKIKVRIVGGQNNDEYKIAKGAKKVHTYDFKSKPNTYDEVKAGTVHELDDYDTNTFHYLNLKSDTNLFTPTIGFNPDDGFRIGFTQSYTFNAFKQNPFTARHSINGAYYFATNGFDLGYKGEFAKIIGDANFEFEARFTSPNFAINFFGFGNETENFDDDLGLDFNRVKIRTITLAPSLVWRGYMNSHFKIGVSYENYDVEETEDRFIENFFSGAGRDSQQDFLGVQMEYGYSNSDDKAFPTMGMEFLVKTGYTSNISDSGRSFGYLIPSLSVDYKIASSGNLVLASKVKGHFNFGDDFEFYQAASIGANDGLRGFRFQRFTGKSAFYQNTDLRLSFRKARTGLLPVTPGIFGGFDYGRIWVPGEDSGKWHNSYGGGFFLNGAGLLNANLGLFNSADGIRFAFGLGFGF